MTDEPKAPKKGKVKTKRGNNQGDPYYDTAKGLWYAVVWINGRRVKRSAETKAAAFVRLAELRRLRDQGIDIPPDKLTVTQWVRRWIDSKKAAGLDPGSIRRYEEHLTLRIAKVFSRTSLLKLTTVQVQDSIDALLLLGLARNTVNFYRTVLSSAMEDAVRKNLIPRNPCDGVSLGRVYATNDRRSLSVEEARAFFAKAKGTRFETIYWLAIATGCRRGELLGLRWTNIHWPTGQLTVSAQVKRLGPGGAFGLVEETKGRKAKTLRLPASLVDRLRQQRDIVREMQKTAGVDWHPMNLVFPTSTGRPIKPDYLTQAFNDVRKDAGLPDDVDFHTLRHSSATYYTMLGISTREVQSILGHASINTTEGYTHVLPSMSDEAAKKMDGLLEILGKPDETGDVAPRVATD